MWAGGFPVYLAEAHGARVVDVDGNEYVDFCLGDTGAMAGHSPEPTMAAAPQQAGITVMLPSEDSAWVGADLARRFGLPFWQFSLTATDANRWTLRMLRQITGRRGGGLQLVLLRLVDEAFAMREPSGSDRVARGQRRPDGRPGPDDARGRVQRPGLGGGGAGHGDVACVLMEPALTNIGIVLPEPGFLAGVRAACTEAGTLLVIDETHTLSAGPGGCTAAWGSSPTPSRSASRSAAGARLAPTE